MARRPTSPRTEQDPMSLGSSVEEMLLASLERGEGDYETGRYVMTYKEGAADQGLQWMQTQGFRTADAREFENQAVTLQDIGDADALFFS